MHSPAASGDWGKSLDQLRRGGNGLLVTLDQLQNAASIDLQKQCALAMRGGRISEVLDVVQTFMADACEAAQTSARQQHEHFESAVEQLLFDGPKRLHGYLKDIAQRQAREKIEHTWDEAKQAGMHSVEAQSGGERALADARETAVGRFLPPLQRLAVPKRLEFTCVGCVLVTKKVRGDGRRLQAFWQEKARQTEARVRQECTAQIEMLEHELADEGLKIAKLESEVSASAGDAGWLAGCMADKVDTQRPRRCR
jgi:hypothetical protein